VADELGAKIAQSIHQWRQDLIELSRRNPLLSFKGRATSSVDLKDQSVDVIVSRLRSKNPTYLVGTKAEPKPEVIDDDDLEAQVLELEEAFDYSKHPDALFVNRTQRDLDRAAHNMASRSSQSFLDKGINPLQLALGALRWFDKDEDAQVAPLLLMPARFYRPGPRQPAALSLTDDDPVLNPALSIKLQEFGVNLPPEGDILQAYFESGLDAALNLIRQTEVPEGWRFIDFQVLSMFTFQKEAMYRDLLENEEAVSSNPLVQALGSGDYPIDHDFYFEPLDDSEIDEEAPAEASPLILDADSSQRSAVAAALKGASFVLDGPPGTGKSQTISNMIGALIAAGKSVLFVSEKIVALEVVKERLDARGLASLVFELHSAKTSRKEVAQFLGRSLTSRARVPVSLSQADVSRVRARRIDLNDYADAMNENRSGLFMSIFQALGEIEANGGHSATPDPELDPDSLTAAKFGEITESARKVQKHWSLHLQGPDAVWFGLEDDSELEFKLERLSAALASYDQEYGSLHKAAQALRLQGTFDFPHLLSLLENWSSGDEDFRNEDWLVGANLVSISDHVGALELLAKRVETARESYKGLLGADWDAVPSREDLPTSSNVASVFEVFQDPSAFTLKRIVKLGDLAAQLSSSAATLSGAVSDLSSQLGISELKKTSKFEDYLTALETLISPECPPTSWFTNRVDFNGSRQAMVVLSGLAEELIASRTACPEFTDAALELDLNALSLFFAQNNKFFDQFSREFRERRRALRSVSYSGKFRRAVSEIASAAMWQEVRGRFLLAEAKYAGALEADYSGVDTDWDLVGRKLANAEKIAAGMTVVDGALLERAMTTNTFTSDLVGLVFEGRATLSAIDTLASSSGSPFKEPLLALSLAAVGAKFGELAKAADLIDQVRSDMVRQPDKSLLFKSFVAAMDLVDAFRRDRPGFEAQLNDSATGLKISVDVNEFFANPSMLVERLGRRLRWTVELLHLAKPVDGDESPAQLTTIEFSALASSDISDSLRDSAKKWQVAFDAFCGAFSDDRGAVLEARLHEFGEAGKYLKLLKSKLPEIDRWIELDRNRRVLRLHGCGPALDAAFEMNLDDDAVSGFILCSVLRSWVGHQITEDPRLGDRVVLDRDELILEYRQIDQKLKDHAISQIIESAESRRPRTFQGQAALIQREAEKKLRHKSVRDQIAQSDEVIKALHPCFMMSPLAVSQFLPTDIRFDVVIFDEASQVTPADAINCVYRGSALIAAGDQKQLPPTNFFRSVSGEDEEVDEDVAADYESILDSMKASAEFNSLTLKWHYRSRHEHLIAFSNASFYDGKLITFPGAIDESPDLGVKFFKVEDGVYRRSSGSDNPIEARAVAKRVIHHFDNRPGKSLGVVAFSANQKAAIENAVLLARSERPDLDRLFDRDSGDRQHGFFVSNLESVQGDERDVIIFSVGYGPDETGRVYKSFGPVSQKGGERRLNVAFTRARELVELVSSMDASQLVDLKPGPAQHLRRYLDYAERGPSALYLELGDQGLEPESPFEESVIAQIRGWGYNVQPQVGVAGYRIDIGVLHPQHPGAFLMGIECDGAMYHSSKVARDRDRLRHEVLEGLGWTLHHIWGTAWYRHRDAEIEKLRLKLERFSEMPLAGRLVVNVPRATTAIKVDFEAVEVDSGGDWIEDYLVADVDKIPSHVDLADPANARRLVTLVKDVVAAEEPVHIETLMQRLRSAADIGRVGQRIRKTLERAINLSNVDFDGDFLSVNGSPLIVVRRPHSDLTRDVDRIHPLELKAAALGVCRDSIAISKNALVDAVSVVFGWRRKGDKIVSAIEQVISELLAAGELVEGAGGLRAAKAS
jgi:energy-coupling factor transporter ATP-binding protein EcfA2/very-short-patch-repair endonuclease